MTALRLCKSARRGNRGVAVPCGCFAETRAWEGESLADTVGPTPKMKSQVYPPLKPRVECWFGTFPFASFLPRARPLSSEFYRIHIVAAACIPSSLETSLS
jgi:hypothetical protein